MSESEKPKGMKVVEEALEKVEEDKSLSDKRIVLTSLLFHRFIVEMVEDILKRKESILTEIRNPLTGGDIVSHIPDDLMFHNYIIHVFNSIATLAHAITRLPHGYPLERLLALLKKELDKAEQQAKDYGTSAI